MFDIGLGELALIALLALVIAGPERLPGIMRGLGRFAARARSVAAALRTELEREVGSEESRDRQSTSNAADDSSVDDSSADYSGNAEDSKQERVDKEGRDD